MAFDHALRGLDLTVLTFALFLRSAGHRPWNTGAVIDQANNAYGVDEGLRQRRLKAEWNLP